MTTWPAPIYIKTAIEDALIDEMREFDIEASIAARRAVEIGTRNAIRKHMEEQKYEY